MYGQEREPYDVVVLGAGAAGLMCALRAGQRGKRVLLLERAGQIGSKILISGGGRCNFTNRDIRTDCYLSDNPHFCLSALKSFTQDEFVALVEAHKIPYHEKTLGQLFCDGSAREIVGMLQAECDEGSVVIRTGQKITHVTKPDIFHIETEEGLVQGRSLVLATGGLSIPKMGATSFAYDVAAFFGLPLVNTRPALVPLTFDGEMLGFMRDLSGLSLDVAATSNNKCFRESMIFTHRGLSGPAILQISSYWREEHAIVIDLCPGKDLPMFLRERRQERPKAELKTVLSELMPQRLAQSLSASFTATPMANYSNAKLHEVALCLQQWSVIPSGSEGYSKAEVTAGGISTDALSSKTMQANLVPGLYIIGEAVDVTGWLGGYNFQWAWSSGWAAGSAV